MKNTITLVLVLALGLAMAGLAKAATITVGLGAGYDFDSIQAGIDAANDGDEVLVAPAEYVITEPITFRGKAITVKSESGRDETTIRMGTPANANRASVLIFENNETTASILDGFTITGGIGFRLWNHEKFEFDWIGGGFFFNASSGTVRNCTIVQNSADDGGGGVLVYSESSVVLNNCIIRGNSTTEESGGGVLCWENSSATLTNCTVSENSAGYSGGGLFCGKGSSMTVTGCIIRDNSSTRISMAGGGGAQCYLDSSLAMTDCLIADNYSGCVGGGIFCSSAASVTVTNCVIVGNTARWGGGLGGWETASTIVTNCTIWGNSANIDGGGVGCYDGASSTVTNSIVWGNTSPKGNEIYLEQAPTKCGITYSNVGGGQAGVTIEGGSILNWGAGNIDADPLFADLNNGDFLLKSEAGRWDPNSGSWIQDDVTSPCIDAGDPMSPIGWEFFPNGGFVNMGAYGGTPEASKSYFGEPACGTIIAGDINGDGRVNRADLEIMALHWTDDEPLPLP